MKVNQIYDIVNTITTEITGKENIVNEDLSNIVDVGTEIFNASSVDNYVKTLVDRIGKVIFTNREYRGKLPTVLMDSWEFGSVLEKIQADLPEATENESWELENGASYDPNIFYKPSVSAKFFNSKVTFEIPLSFTEKQVKSSFASATELNAFISMLYNAVDKSMTVKMDSLIMRTINNMIATTFDSNDTNRAINLLDAYNTAMGLTGDNKLTVAKCMTNKEFLRFASMQIALYIDRIGTMSTLFNGGGKERFTPKDLLHIVLLSNFTESSKMYLESDTFHNELVALPNFETVPFWQGSGKTYSFDDVSKIMVTIKNGNSTKQVNVGGILGVMFDRDSLGVANVDKRVTTNYNPKAEFYNNWFKFDAGYFNDFNENFIMFYVADTTE